MRGILKGNAVMLFFMVLLRNQVEYFLIDPQNNWKKINVFLVDIQKSSRNVRCIRRFEFTPDDDYFVVET